ncbi:alpha/beta fold hydrolase [Halothermothrix orenii]|uniref:Surface antigen (D15) n=1 Tax=Halothermothrix orenii (strain H 168 / OCM 544 / DSM 9562) TaxID=373903 RepID=B8CZJ0_HALOH|nr:alpha/beta fold hydrolase [Halothermothrix orenii]ACL70709.1 surface antigen (D15) [Halothermothrix orenii H 168]
MRKTNLARGLIFFFLTIILLSGFLSDRCEAGIFESIINDYFNKTPADYTVRDIPERGWGEVTFPDYGGEKRVSAFLRTVDSPHFNVIFVHGYGRSGKSYYFHGVFLKHYIENSSRYKFNEMTIDLAGWGGLDHRFNGFNDYSNDILGAVKYLERLSPDIPTIVVGHSLGGYSVLLAAARDQEGLIDGIISASPFSDYMRLVREYRFGDNYAFPWIFRNFIGVADKRLDGFFSDYNLEKLVSDIRVPVLIMSGKLDHPPFKLMAFDIYNKIPGHNKQLYYFDANHFGYYYFQSRQVRAVLNNYFDSIYQGKRLNMFEVPVSAKVLKKAKGYQVMITLDKRINKPSPVQVCLEKDGELTYKKYVFSPDQKRAVFNLSFKPESYYVFRPVIAVVEGKTWHYRLSDEEKAFARLYIFENSSRGGLSDPGPEEQEALQVLKKSNKVYYLEWLAESLARPRTARYREAIDLYEKMLTMDVHENIRVKSLYKIYVIYRDGLKDKGRAEFYYNKLREYDHRKTLVARAIDYERNNLDYGEKSYVVGDIKIIGLTRSNQGLITSQLPFRIGAPWTREIKDLTEQRLYHMNIFNPLNLKVEDKVIEGNKVSVVIRVHDSNPFMIHPGEFVIFKTINLASSQFTQRLRNPLGNGLSPFVGVNWSAEPWWLVGFDYTARQGWVTSCEYINYTRREEFNNISFSEKGFKTSLNFSNTPAPYRKVEYSLGYQEQNYKKEDASPIEQKYLIPGITLSLEEVGNLIVHLDYAYSPGEGFPDFVRSKFKWHIEKKAGQGRLIFSFNGGLSSSNTPLNYQFKGGGFSSIPLRGQSYDRAGTRYLSTSVEYHHPLLNELVSAIIFVDGGKIIPVSEDFSTINWEVDGGLGVAIYTPLGPVRADLGFDRIDRQTTFNMGFGHSF